MEIKNIDSINYLLENNRVFLPSINIDVFPCARRGQSNIENNATYYDPEARLNTERTNRIGTAINGFTDSFIINFERYEDAVGNNTETGTLTFTLAGYRAEVRNFNPANIAEVLGDGVSNIYAYLSIQNGISLNLDGYSTEILYRQLDIPGNNKNYLDATASYNNISVNPNITYTDSFFVGIAFTANSSFIDAGVEQHWLPLFTGETVEVEAEGGTKSQTTEWKLVETSKLPKIEHGDEEDSIHVYKLSSEEVAVNTAIINNVRVPYDGEEALGFSDTIINNSGLITPNIKARSLEADGISVGSSISIKNSIDASKETIVSSDGIVTTGSLSVNTDINTPKAAITETLSVHNEDNTAQANIDAITTKTVGTTDHKVENIYAIDANISKLAAGTVSADTAISAPKMYQKHNGNAETPVPIIELEGSSSPYKLKIWTAPVSTTQN